MVSMNWMSIKPIAGPHASNDTKRLASTRARRSSKATNCQLQVQFQASAAKDRLESRSLHLHAFWVPARLMSTEQQLFFFRERRTGEPKPVSARRDKLPIIRPRRQKSTPDNICCQSAAAPHPGSRVAKLNGRQDSSQREHSRDRTCSGRKRMTE